MPDIDLPLGAELERMLERIECELYEDAYAAIPADVAREAGLEMQKVGSERIFLARKVAHPYFNRVMGIGLDGPPDEKWLDERLALFREIGAPRYMLQVLPHVESSDLTRALKDRGIERLRGWAKHAGRARSGRVSHSNLRLEVATAHEADTWAELCADAFGFPPSLRPWLAALIGRPHWTHYLAYDGDEPIATASLFQRHGFATLTFAATRSDARGHGAQTALIGRRLKDAADAGCNWILTETDEDTPERPNPSHHNVVRLGLPVRYVRANWGPPKPAEA